jgi:hypothetical protein
MKIFLNLTPASKNLFLFFSFLFFFLIMEDCDCSNNDWIIQFMAYEFYFDKAFFFFFLSTGAWTQGIHLEPLHQPFFCEGFFKTGSCELFARADFEPRSSWSLPPE